MTKRKWVGLTALGVSIVVVLGVTLGIGLMSPAGGETEPTKETIEKAKESVRQFEGDPLLDVEENLLPFTPPQTELITLRSDNTLYGVNPENWRVELVSYADNMAGNEVVLILKEEAEAIATEFAQKHCEMFSIFTLTSSELTGYEGDYKYDFQWTQLIDGVSTPNFVKVSVNPGTGGVTSYVCRYQPMEPAGSPSLSKEEAIAIVQSDIMREVEEARNWVSDAEVERISILEGPELKIITENGKDYLTWRLLAKAEVTYPPGYAGGEYYVHAQTGDIIRFWPFL